MLRALLAVIAAATAAPSRGDLPHIALKMQPRVAIAGQEITVTGRPGYSLGAGSDFCLEPEWDVFGSNSAGGLHKLVAKPPDPVQCRDHDFSHTFTFANPGKYGVRLVLRTTGSKVRVADWGFLYVDIGGN